LKDVCDLWCVLCVSGGFSVSRYAGSLPPDVTSQSRDVNKYCGCAIDLLTGRNSTYNQERRMAFPRQSRVLNEPNFNLLYLNK